MPAAISPGELIGKFCGELSATLTAAPKSALAWAEARHLEAIEAKLNQLQATAGKAEDRSRMERWRRCTG